MNRAHFLKTWPAQFAALSDESKTFEYRDNDRGYAEGDALVLAEWRNTEPTGKEFTGRILVRIVTYVMRGGFGLAPGYVIMSIVPPKNGDEITRALWLLRTRANTANTNLPQCSTRLGNGFCQRNAHSETVPHVDSENNEWP